MYADTGQRRKLRAVVVAVAVFAAVVWWAVVEYAVGLDLKAPISGGAPQMDVGVVQVIVSSLFAGLAAWALLALLERFVGPARTMWTVIAVVMLLLSLGAPFSGTGVTTGNRLSLAAEHILVGAILIVGLYRTARSGPRQTAAPAEAA